MILTRHMIRAGLVAGCISMIFAGQAAAQAPADLGELASKQSLSADERKAVAEGVLREIEQLKGAETEKARLSARQKLIAPLSQAGDSFREAFAAAAGSELAASLKLQFEPALDAMLVLAAIEHPATLGAISDAMASRYAAVRYLAARSLRAMHAKLKTQLQYRTAINALSDAGEHETDPATLRMIYQALDFSETQKQFAGAGDVADALGKIMKARLAMGSSGADAVADSVAYQAAQRAGNEAKAPPVQLVEGLAGSLLELARAAMSDRSGGRAEEIAECETALTQILEKHGGGAANLPRLAEVARGDGDPKKIDAALTALIGSGSAKGLLNKAPWNLPVGLPRAQAEKKAPPAAETSDNG